MTKYFLPMGVIILSVVFYNILQKEIPQTVHPVVSLIVTYAVSLIICLILLAIHPLKSSLGQAFRGINWASYVLGASIVGIEWGYLVIYRSGWKISLAPIVANAAVALMLIPVGLSVYKERLSLVNVLGIILSVMGLILINVK